MIRGDVWGLTSMFSVSSRPLQHIQDGISLQIHNQRAASRKDLKRALPRTCILILFHTECLRLEGMPGLPLYIELFAKSAMVLTDLRWTPGDGLCDSEWRSSRLMVESALEGK